MMNQHQSIKAEIDSRDDSFTQCFNLGKEMLSRDHYASEEVCVTASFGNFQIRKKFEFRVGVRLGVPSLLTVWNTVCSFRL